MVDSGGYSICFMGGPITVVFIIRVLIVMIQSRVLYVCGEGTGGSLSIVKRQ